MGFTKTCQGTKRKMNKPKAYFIVSRFNENIDWITDYTDEALIINKGEYIYPYSLSNKIYTLEAKNIGGNQRDICYFAYEEYDNLPELMVFVQAYPFDHCNKTVFDKLIYREEFTPLEYYGLFPQNDYEARDNEGGFMELNNSWYILAHNRTKKQTCAFYSFDDFMNTFFSNYSHLGHIRFTPGSQYIVEKKQILQYPKEFWGELMNLLNSKSPTEGHVLERALYHILVGTYKLREKNERL